jgi:ectoine hydroxylase-related dioxygenase (phytanoyl-CoA dioxygenase family)
MSIVPGSHTSLSSPFPYLRERYGRQLGKGKEGDGTKSGWVPDSELKDICWYTQPLKMGDVVVLHLDVLHKTLPNTSGVMRYSCDCRFQPVSHEYPPF